MTRYMLVAVGGAIGAVARYLLTGIVQYTLGPAFPYGTLAVNVVGCFLVGALMTAFELRLSAPPEARAFLVVGVLGGLTTFSAFGYETDALLRNREMALVFWNVLSNVGLGVGAVVVGRAVVLSLG